ncbi:MAG: FkbM family methyltransferase, partial [Chloroflexi bacterium]|nr:FkbM family methyltransferase [Chloroflexota bacterium]
IFKKLNLTLFHLSLRGLGILNTENDKVSGERYLITTILPKVIKNDCPLFFDIGANIGNYSLTLLDYFPKAFIHTFEPHPKNYSRLKERMPSNKVKSHNVAIGESEGKLTLYDRSDRDGSTHASLYEAVISELHRQESVTLEVAVETLDSFVEREGISYIDFMKIDTEGNELAVLQGASNLIEQERIGCIHFEFNEMNIISKVFFRDFRKTLSQYRLFRLLPSDLLPLNKHPLTTELFAYQNILALPKKHADEILTRRSMMAKAYKRFFRK